MMTEDRREAIYGPDRVDLCDCGRKGLETTHETNPYGHVHSCASIPAVLQQESDLTVAYKRRPEPSVVDQEPTDLVPQPDMCGTFAVYVLPDGTAGLVLDVKGETEPRRMLLPKMIVDMVLYGKKPSMKDTLGMLGGLR